MMEKANIKWHESNDDALQSVIGRFIQETRLQQNKNQQQVADAAGINRSTLSQIENGSGGTILSLIQILRVLDQLNFLDYFQVQTKLSPIQLAKLEQKQRRRARNKNTPESNLLPDW
jgi:transcriptional regulator with XRE-family HTH domain